MSRQLSPAMAIAMLVIILTGFAAFSVSHSNREESQIDNRFDKTTKQWMNKLKDEIVLLKRKYNTKIDRLEVELNSYELPQDVKDSISTTILNLMIEIGKLEKVHWEIEYLSKSNQTYLVVEHDTLPVPAYTCFNKKTGGLNTHIFSDGLIGLFAHELLHVYQFERGLTSLGDPVDTVGKPFLHDSTDEIAAYKRQAMFGDTVDYSVGYGTSLPIGPNSIYNFNRDTSTYQVNLPVLIKKGNIGDLRKVADTMKQAYRVQIDGKWVTITMD